MNDPELFKRKYPEESLWQICKEFFKFVFSSWFNVLVFYAIVMLILFLIGYSMYR